MKLYTVALSMKISYRSPYPVWSPLDENQALQDKTFTIHCSLLLIQTCNFIIMQNRKVIMVWHSFHLSKSKQHSRSETSELCWFQPLLLCYDKILISILVTSEIKDCAIFLFQCSEVTHLRKGFCEGKKHNYWSATEDNWPASDWQSVWRK